MRVLLSFRSVWYDVEHFPSSWKLDPTEGPDRVRCRLQRFHLDVEEKSLMKEYCGKSEKIFFIGVFHWYIFALIIIPTSRSALLLIG